MFAKMQRNFLSDKKMKWFCTNFKILILKTFVNSSGKTNFLMVLIHFFNGLMVLRDLEDFNALSELILLTRY